MKTYFMSLAALFFILIWIAGCAGPAYVKQCSKMANSCEVLMIACRKQTDELDFVKLRLHLCDKENERFMDEALNEVKCTPGKK